MSIRKTRQIGVELTPENIEGMGGTDLNREGELSVDSSDSELKVHLDSATRTVVTEDQTQVLTNKTIDADLNTISDLEVDNLKAGVLNTSTTLSGASDTQVPSALAVKTYVDNNLALQNEASEISVVPAGTITSTNVQAALEELDSDIQGHINDTTDAHDASAISNSPSGNLAATDVQGALNELQSNIDSNYTELTNHISDTSDAHDASAISVIPTGNLAADDVQEALVELQTSIDNIPTDSLTFTNKSLVDASTFIVDSVDPTVKIAFNAEGSPATTTTILSAQTANRTIVLPDASTVLAGTTNVQTIQNKAFTDSLNAFVDSSDPTKEIKFDAVGTTGTKTTIRSSQTADVVVTLPNATDTLVGKATTDILTNKTFDADGTGNSITNIENADIKAAANIERTKLASGTNYRLLANNATGVMSENAALTSGRIPFADANGQLTDASDFTAGTNFIKLGNTKHIEIAAATDSATTGANASLASFVGGAIRLTNASLASLANIPAGADGQELILFNRTGAALDIIDSSSASGTAANRIFTGSGATIEMAENAALYLKYDSTSARWQIIGGSGSGGGGATALAALTDVTLTSPANEQYLVYDAATSKWVNRTQSLEEGTMLRQNFDYAQLTDFTHTNLTLSSVNPIRGIQSAKLLAFIGAVNFKQVIPVAKEFRGKNNTLSLYFQSSAVQGNVTITIYDETNAATLATSQPLTLGSDTITGTLNSGTANVTGVSTADINKLKVGQIITGTTITTDTVITAIGTNSFTMSQTTSGSATLTLRISALPARQAFTFNIPNNCSSISYTINSALDTGNTISYFDDISIKLTEVAQTTTSITVPKNNDTEWAPATFSTLVWQGLGTVTNNSLQVRRQGSNLLMRGRFTTGTVTGSIVQIPLPSNFGSLTTSASIGVNEISNAYFRSVANNSALGAIILQPSVSYFNESAAIASASNNPTTPLAGTPSYGSGEAVEIGQVSIPIAGWLANETESKTIPLTSAQLVQTPDSTLRLTGTPGRGSTNTTVLRFSTVQDNIGSDVNYVDSATDGASFKILNAGNYDITADATNTSTVDTAIIGITKNSTQLTTSPQTISAANRLAITQDRLSANSGSAKGVHVSWSGYLNVGDIIRIQVSPDTMSDGNFTISKSGSLKQLNFSSDSKIQIPTHQLRFEGASSRGSTDTAIVKFDTQAITQGDAWDVVNTAANGTVVTMKKAGKLSVQTSLYSTVGADLYISKNQAILNANPVTSEIYSSITTSSTQRSTASANIDVVVGDKIRIAASGAVAAATGVNLTLSLTESSIPANFSNVLPQWSQSDSSVRLNTANGYGSTATMIRRFTNTLDNLGTAITYTDSAANGASFTINEDGNYSIMFTDQFNAAAYLGISKNSNQLTTNIFSITAADRLSIATTSAANNSAVASWSGYLAKGDVIRPHGDATPIGNDASRVSFTISKVGKPNLSSVDVTSFVNMKTTDTQTIAALPTVSTTVSGANVVAVLTTNTNNGILSYNTTTGVYTALKAAKVDMQLSLRASGANTTIPSIYLNGTLIAQTNSSPNTGYWGTTSASFTVNANDTFYARNFPATNSDAYALTITAVADNNATASPTQQVSSDTMSFAFKATTIDPNVDPVGTFNTYSYLTPSSPALTLNASAPTQTTSDMNVNGVRLFTRAYNAASSAASPARVDIFIGKGLKSKQVDAYFAAAKTTPLIIDNVVASSTDEKGANVFYSELTGVLTIDVGASSTSTNTARFLFDLPANAARTSGYFVFNASKSPSLVTIPTQQAVSALYTGAPPTGTLAAAFNTVTFGTRVKDTHGAYSSGTYTIPVTGTYSFSVGVAVSGTYNGAQQLATAIYVNGIAKHQNSNAPTSSIGRAWTNVSVQALPLIAGDLVTIRVYNDGTGLSYEANATTNYFSVVKVGN